MKNNKRGLGLQVLLHLLSHNVQLNTPTFDKISGENQCHFMKELLKTKKYII